MPKAKQKTDLEILQEMLAKNPNLLESIQSIGKTKSSPKLPKGGSVTAPPKRESVTDHEIMDGPCKGIKQVFYDNPEAGKAEGKWDKKKLKGFKASERTRKVAEKKKVICGSCGKTYEISELLFDPENTNVCNRCAAGG